MIKKEAVGMNKRICTAAAVLALTMCTVHAEAVYNLDEVIVEADMDKARDAFGDIVTEQSYARTGGDVEVITRKEIEEKHFQNITDAFVGSRQCGGFWKPSKHADGVNAPCEIGK